MFRLGSALLLGAFVTGCGFRSSLSTGDFEIVSFALDQPSYVQGESGIATAFVRNLGPTTLPPPEMTLHIPHPTEEEEIELYPTDAPAQVLPGEAVKIEWTFTVGEAYEPGLGYVYAKLYDVDGVTKSEILEVEVLRAATLEVFALAYIHPLEGGDGEPPNYACRGVRAANVEATLRNVGGSVGNLTDTRILFQRTAGGSQDHFNVVPNEANPSAVAPNATVVLRFHLEALVAAPVAEDYWLELTANVVDATTGLARPAPSQPEALDLPFTVHQAATFGLLIGETATQVSLASPDAGTVSVEINNTGTVPLKIDTVPLRMFIGGLNTTTEYAIGTPSITLPFDLQPGGQITANLAVSLSAIAPTMGATISQGLATGTDEACAAYPSGNSEANASEGDWIVVP